MSKKWKRFLLVDVSNTNTKFAVSELLNSDIKNKNNLLPKITNYLESIPTKNINKRNINKIISDHKIDKIALCSVVPEKNVHFKNSDADDVLIINSEVNLGIDLNYPDIKTIGADRLANSVYTVKVLKKFPSVVIDFGTTVTFDIINEIGEFSGGVICPGLDVMTHYLKKKTALLPKIDIKKPSQIIGKSTKNAMLSGTYYGYRGLIREVIKNIKKELNHKDLYIVATGSYSEIILKNFKLVNFFKKNITLEGVNKILSLNL